MNPANIKQSEFIDKGMKKINNSSLEIAREDHATIIKKILNV